MESKNIKEEDLKFRLSINDYDSYPDEDGEYPYYDIILDESFFISNHDRLNLIKELKESRDAGEGEKGIGILYKDNRIGSISFKVLDKVSSIYHLISEMEAFKGDAGVCACEIHLNKLYNKVRGKRLVYIHYINLNDEYNTYANEEIILRNLILLLKKIYRVKNIFARPIARDLEENEMHIHRHEYYLTEYLHYRIYRELMVGYVMSYYQDIPEVVKALDNLSELEIKRARKGYLNKLYEAQLPYINCGMKVISKEAGVLAII